MGDIFLSLIHSEDCLRHMETKFPGFSLGLPGRKTGVLIQDDVLS